MSRNTRYIIRPMRDSDIPQVIDIDHEAFPAQWPPISYTSYKQELHNQLARYMVIYKEKRGKTETGFRKESSWFKCLFNRDRFLDDESISPREDYIVGFAGFWIMSDEAHLTNIAVREAYYHQGLGESLLISVIELAAQLGARTVTLEVRVSNKVAQNLYRKYGFQEAEIRHGYYSDNGEDALFMSTDTISSAPFQAHFQQLKQAHSQKWQRVFTLVNQIN